MMNIISYLKRNLSVTLITAVGITLFVAITAWAFLIIGYQKRRLEKEVITSVDRLSHTIILGTHYAMMLNAKQDITQIIKNIANRKDIVSIRIYNKAGEIKFSNIPSEVDKKTHIKSEACNICHRTDPPLVSVDLANRTRIARDSPIGHRIGIISPIYNEPSCSSESCHFHPEDKKVLGALDVVVSLADMDHELLFFTKNILGLAVILFLLTAGIIFLFVLKLVQEPMKELIKGTKRIASGDYSGNVTVRSRNEIGHLAGVINMMAREIGEKEAELNRQKNIYQNLFETVPCIITVQDRNYRLIQYNREFAKKFNPVDGDFCYRAYKGRKTKCPVCPVEKTFADGRSHLSEESGVKSDGSPAFWLVKTSPIYDEKGNIVAAMEMNIDITQKKLLEQKLLRSEKKYHAIFDSIPNPVFVLDKRDLKVIDCNESALYLYGYTRFEIMNRSFVDLFPPGDRDLMEEEIKRKDFISQARQVTRNNRNIYVNIRISPSEYSGRDVFLVITSDITKRLETEQQLILASKMATLGEMATGVAHELNQPLTVIKVASNYFMRKIINNEKIEYEILKTMASEINSHVDRAVKIINHMRQFGRKTDLSLKPVNVNDVIKKSFDLFSQQLTVHGIRVEWNLYDKIPEIEADPDRLEQVFINLLINARDAILDTLSSGQSSGEKIIRLETKIQKDAVMISICDTGVGIAPEIKDKIFEPFFTTKEVGKGTGLGLSISYGIIKDFGGEISVRPNRPQGACFVISLPKRRKD